MSYNYNPNDYTRKCNANLHQHQPTHFNPITSQYIHVYGEQRYEHGTHGNIVIDALTCGSVYQEQRQITVDYNPLQSLTFRTVR